MTTIRPTTWANSSLADALDTIVDGVGSLDEQEKAMLIKEAARRLRLVTSEPMAEASREFAGAMVRLVRRLHDEGAL